MGTLERPWPKKRLYIDVNLKVQQCKRYADAIRQAILEDPRPGFDEALFVED